MSDEKPGQPVEHNLQEQAPSAPAFGNSPQPQNSTRVREQEEQSRIANLEDRMRSAEKIMAWFTGAIALFALASVIVGALQWHVMSTQLEDSEAGQRANLVLETFEADWPSENSPIEIHCTIWNAGQTTALFMSVSSGGGGGGAMPVNKDGNRTLPIIAVNGIPNPSDTGPSLGQNQRRDCSWTQQFSSTDRDYISKLRMGDMVHTFTISVSYKDVFGKSWVVNDCLAYWVKHRGSGQGRFAHCTMQPMR